MANKIRHLLHRRSLKSSPFIVNIERDTLEVQNPKAPFAENIEYGELAVNYGKGHEGLFLRNSENEVIQLNTMKHIRYDGAVDKSFGKYLDDRYVNRSGDTMYGDFTITKDLDTDDPKFRYIGSYFLIDSVDTDISGNTLDMIENTTTIDIETGFTNIKEHKYEGIKLDADITNADYSGNTFVMEQATSISAKTPKFTLSSTTTNITGVTSVNISGKTTDMQGNLLDVDYSNIDLSGSTDIDIISPIVNIDASNLVDISGKNEVHIDSVGGTVYIDGKTTTMDGDLLQVTYKNIDIKGTADIDVISPDIDIDVTNFTLSGTTTNLKGTTYNENYTNINRTATTVTNNVTTENDNFTTWNLSATTNNLEGTDLNVDYDNIDINDKQIYINKTVDDEGNSTTEVSVNTDTLNITGTTKIDGTLNVTSNVDFDSDLNVDGNSNLVGTLVVSGATTIDDTLKVTGLATFNGGIEIPDGYTFEGELNKTLTFTSGDVDSGKTYSFDNTSDVTVPYVNNGGDTMTGKLTISSGGLDVTGDVKTSTKFIGKLDKTLTLNSGTFSAKTFNNSDNITVNIPTDISHLSFTGEPSSWSSLDSRYVNVDGDTMNGALNFKVSSAETNATTINTDGSASFGSNVTVSGDLHVVGTISGDTAIYSSDVKLKDNIKKINKYDIATVADVDLMSYTFKKDETHRGRYGVIAQDLETIGLEHLVVTSEDGTKGVDYISFLILKIAQLEKEIEELKNKK